MSNVLKGLEQEISVNDWLHYDPDVGIDQMHISGYPGSGKSNMSTGLLAQAIDKKGEYVILPGDRFCEWRHFINHPLIKDKGKNITILVPKGKDIYYYGFQKNGWFIDVDYQDIDIFDYLTPERPLLVIYDNHLRLLNGDRTNLWVKIFEQALNRREHLDNGVGFLFHEAGNHFPEGAEGDHWKAVRDFQELFVEARKAWVRTVLVSQLLTEVKSTLRGKCMYNIFRKSYLSYSSGFPKPLIKVLPFTAIDRYHICKGRGIYKRHNIVNKFFENKKILKMIPPHSSMNGGSPSTKDQEKDFKKRLIQKNGSVFEQITDSQGKIITNKKVGTLIDETT